MRRHATTIVLLFVALALGVWLWLDRDQVTEGERARREHSVFAAWRRDDVSRIEIGHDGETIVLEKEPGEDALWRMLSPRDERVDPQAVERLMTTFEFASVVRKVGSVSGEDDAQLGFDAPRAWGSVTMGSLRFRFALGAESPRPEGSGYLRVDDGAPFVASRELVETLLASSDTYRDRTVVPYLSLEMARFEVLHEGGGFEVERLDARSFKVGGLGLIASRAALDRIWTALAEMRAETFPKDADAERLTERPRLTVRMTSKESGRPPGEILVGAECPGHPNDVVVLRTKPTRVAACAPKGAVQALLELTPESLVDERPFSLRHDEIEELRLERIGDGVGPSAIEVARKGTGFYQREPEARDLSAGEADAVSELLVRIERDRADEVAPSGGAPFEAAYRAKIRAGEHEEAIEIGALDAGAGPVRVRRLRDGALLSVSRAVARRLVPRETTTRPRELLTDTRRVQRVVLRCGAAQELVDEGNGLRLVDPAGYDTDGAIVQLVDALFRGKVDAWVADADDGSFGMEPEGCRVVVAFADGDAPVTVRFGAEGEGGVYGTVDGRPEVFVAPPSLVELAKRIYVSRASLRVDPARVESVRVTARGAAVRADPAGFREAMGGLFADRVVTLDASDVGRVEVEITVALVDAGGAKRIVCGPVVDHWRRCAVSGTRAVFDVHPSSLRGLVELPDAGEEPPGSEAGASGEGEHAGGAGDDPG